MTRVIPLSSDTIARNKPLHVPSNLKNNTCITITCVSWETWLPAWLTPVYIIVYLRANTDRRVFVLDEHAVIRHGRKFVFLQLDTPKICVN